MSFVNRNTAYLSGNIDNKIQSDIFKIYKSILGTGSEDAFAL